MSRSIKLSGQKFDVDPGFNLYIDVSSACNGSCAFCIAQTVGRKDGPGFFEGAKFALGLTESVRGTVQVVGGEPMISRRFPLLMANIAKHGFGRVIVNTNGSALTDGNIRSMNSANVNCVNVSRHHFDEDRNQSIMRLRPGLSNRDLARGISELQQSSLAVRMQCNLIRGQIDNLESIVEYIKWCNSLGCYNISFSQVFPLSLFDYQVPIEHGYTEKVQIDLRELVRNIDTSEQFTPFAWDEFDDQTFMSHGGSSAWAAPYGYPKDREAPKPKPISEKEKVKKEGKRRYWHGPSDTTISIKTLSGYDENNLPRATTYSKDADWELSEGVLAFAVVHSDGVVAASWDKRERTLFVPQKVHEKSSLLDRLLPKQTLTQLLVPDAI